MPPSGIFTQDWDAREVLQYWPSILRCRGGTTQRPCTSYLPPVDQEEQKVILRRLGEVPLIGIDSGSRIRILLNRLAVCTLCRDHQGNEGINVNYLLRCWYSKIRAEEERIAFEAENGDSADEAREELDYINDQGVRRSAFEAEIRYPAEEVREELAWIWDEQGQFAWTRRDEQGVNAMPGPLPHCDQVHVSRRALDQDCPICWCPMEEDLPELVWCKSECGKTFHKECVDDWLNGPSRNSTCGQWYDQFPAPLLTSCVPSVTDNVYLAAHHGNPTAFTIWIRHLKARRLTGIRTDLGED